MMPRGLCTPLNVVLALLLIIRSLYVPPVIVPVFSTVPLNVPWLIMLSLVTTPLNSVAFVLPPWMMPLSSTTVPSAVPPLAFILPPLKQMASPLPAVQSEIEPLVMVNVLLNTDTPPPLLLAVQPMIAPLFISNVPPFTITAPPPMSAEQPTMLPPFMMAVLLVRTSIAPPLLPLAVLPPVMTPPETE